jgi:hypothetical protein
MFCRPKDYGESLTGIWKHRNNVDVLLKIAGPTEKYIEQLLFSLTADMGGRLDGSIIARFLENAGTKGNSFTMDFKLDAVLRTCMYWTFKARIELETVYISNPPDPVGCLNLLKAYWIFRQLREDPRIDYMTKEFQAILSLVSNVISSSISSC